MPSGIVVQHNHVSADFYGVVRSDLTAIISFLESANWADGKEKGGRPHTPHQTVLRAYLLPMEARLRLYRGEY